MPSFDVDRRSPQAVRSRRCAGAITPLLGLAALASCASGPAPGSPVEADPIYREARIDLGAERPQSAAEKLQGLVAKYGTDPVLLRWLGRARILAGKGPAGREALRQALEKDPSDSQARLWLADSCFDAGADVDADARAQYEMLLNSDPENEHVLRRLAALHLRGGDERAALAKLEILLRRYPQDRALREDAILAADGAADWPTMLRHTAAHLANHGRTAVVLQADARAKLGGDPSAATEAALRSALPLLGEALLLEPNDADLAYGLGLVHLHLARKGSAQLDQSSAERFLRRALEMDPRHVDAAQALASLYEEQRNPQRALPLLEHVLQILVEADRGQSLGLHAERIRVLRSRIESLTGGRAG